LKEKKKKVCASGMRASRVVRVEKKKPKERLTICGGVDQNWESGNKFAVIFGNPDG